MNGIMKRLLQLAVLFACLLQVTQATAQSPRERITKLRDLLKSVQRTEQGDVVQVASQEPLPAGGVAMQLSDQLKPAPQPAARIADADAGLPPGVVIPKKKITLPRTYHGRVAGANEPGIGRRGDDPWDLARRLGIADNASYPIPENLRHVDLIRQTDGDAFLKSEGCIHCHTDVGHMHPVDSIQIGCTDCHGGDATCRDIKGAHVWPRFADALDFHLQHNF